MKSMNKFLIFFTIILITAACKSDPDVQRGPDGAPVTDESFQNTRPGQTYPHSADEREINPPASASQHFQSEYQGAEDVRWLEDEEGVIAFYHRQGQNYSTIYTGEGEWLETRREITLSEAPVPVRGVHERGQFRDWDARWYQVRTPQGRTFYSAEVHQAQVRNRLYYNEEGELINRNQIRNQ